MKLGTPRQGVRARWHGAEASELRECQREKIPHNVLNAKFHARNRDRRRWSAGHGTISTNMAGANRRGKLERCSDRAVAHVIGTGGVTSAP